MKVLVTGATGFVGRPTVLALLRRRHRVTAWVRDLARARATLGAEPHLVSDRENPESLEAAVRDADAIVHLAGAPVADRWTAAHKEELLRSRLEPTRRITGALRAGQALVSASAVGFYGPNRGEEVLTASSPPGEGFLADLCKQWEAAAVEGERAGARVARFRIGVVLGPGGGALEKLIPIFRLGLGGPLGGGHQYMPWVHLADVVETLADAVEDSRFTGAFNLTAPEPVTNAELSEALGAALGRPAVLPTPGFAVKLVMGESAEIALGGQRAIPERLLELGVRFRFPELSAALGDLFDDGVSVRAVTPGEVPKTAYLDARPPRWVLEQQTELSAPIDEVFAFFAKAENLGVMTPPTLAFDIRTKPPIELGEGTEIEYRIRLGALPMDWRTRIERFEPGAVFVDAQLDGPYSSWWHEHAFEAVGSRTRMRDRVFFAVPLGPLGGLPKALFVEPKLREIFGYRRQAIGFRFGLSPPGR